MELELGAIIAGKVTGITKFGAFVTLESGKSGLVHISEIANSYVAEVSDKLTVGQDVTVKVIGLDGTKINLSIKQALPPEERQERRPFTPRSGDRPNPRYNSASREGDGDNNGGYRAAPRNYTPQATKPAAPAPDDFEGRLQKFMKDADSKMSGMRQFNDKRGRRKK